MSKESRIAGFALAQIGMLEAKDNKARLPYIISKIEDGKVYDSKGNVYCEDFDGADVVFITDEDLSLTRITAVKITKIKEAMDKYFNAEPTEDANEEPETTETEEVAEEVAEETTEEPETEKTEKTIDVDAVTDACLEAIEKGKVKKAGKLIEKLNEAGVKTKKLQKKLDKVSK